MVSLELLFKFHDLLFSIAGLILDPLFCMLIYSFLYQLVEVTPQICHGAFQYERCSTNAACRCLHRVGAAAGTGICVMDQFIFTGLASCLPPNNWCLDQTAICVNHPLYSYLPACLPKAETDPRMCLSTSGKRSTKDLEEDVLLRHEVLLKQHER